MEGLKRVALRVGVLLGVVWAIGCGKVSSEVADVKGGDGVQYDEVMPEQWTEWDGEGVYTVDEVPKPSWYDAPGAQDGQILAGLYSLHPADSCDDLNLKAKEALVRAMKEACYTAMVGILQGQECWDDWGDDDGYSSFDCMADSTGGGDAGATEYSTTNTQEVDVDEPDFIKNDGNYIYILAGGEPYLGANLQIWDVWPAAESHLLSSTLVPGYPRKLFVYEGRAVVFSSSNQDGGSYECTYGYDCDFSAYPGSTYITVLDLADPTAPTILRELRSSSGMLGARRVDGRVFVALAQNAGSDWVPYETVPAELEAYRWRCKQDELPFTLQQVFDLYAALVEANEAAILAGSVAVGRPSLEDKVGQTTLPDPYQDCSNYYTSALGETDTMLSVLAFDLLDSKPATAVGVLAGGGVIYASKDSLFVGLRYHRYNWQGANGAPFWFEELGTADEATVVHGFKLGGDGPAVSYNGSGVVPGRFLNQFSFSKKDEYLRVVTTTGYLPYDAYNSLFILKHDGQKWAKVGALESFGENEDVRSVRYNGDFAYVVTFKKTDPLFVIDLTDPTKPTVKGELKIPGFSTYMQFMDATHIISIGYDADDHGDFAYFDGIQLQIFDVSDISNPTLLWKEVIGTRGSSSEAAGNHYAFNYFKARNLLAIPMSICEGGDDGEFGYNQTFDGLLVYQVTVAEGFTKLGGINHQDEAVGTECGEWWTEMSSSVKRSVILEDWVYSVAMDRIKVANKATLDQIVATLDLAGN